ncbi:MAG: type VII secretion-associated serine protease mycosin [Candidatus Accumulibacter appositus]|uniref:Type VII secretion-associated serine protease mycosin n=1 Tax=Candidatus Accumulibacter appositus TaxID=1454003 RepID=A0A011NTV6_9PROT|nr:S8 family serine peptidase [Accumulibacter sp.]EXI78796.1 MAG: type VII secretion-associated serine protease mycosin [Candidatus Accumulibacter appositus]HRF05806.1 S8 family serine peptidase [Accumulibacter sp.]
MARTHAFLQTDPDRAPEQDAFLRPRVRVLREAGGQFWVELDEAQVDSFVAEGFLVSTFAAADVVDLGPLSFRPASETPQPPAALRARPPTGDDAAFWIVHFIAPADKAWLVDIALAGGEQVQLIDALSSVFSLSLAASEAVRAMPWVDFVGLYHPAYAVSLDLAAAEQEFTASSLATLSVQLPPADADGNLQVTVFDGVDPESVRPALEAAGASVLVEVAQGFVLQVEPAAAAAVLSVPGIYAAAPPASSELCNHNAGVILGANQVRDLGTVNFLVNLDGLAEIGAVVDSGFDVGTLAGAVVPATGAMTAFHPDLLANIRLLRNSSTPQNAALTVPDNAPHGTHVAGTVAGDGSSSAGITRGMAPRAALIGLAPLPANLRVPFDFAASNGARVINNSWGSGFFLGANNNRYTPNESQAVDRWCFEHPDVLVVFAAGNAEADTQGGGNGVLDARSLRLEATAKNAFTVGASENLRSDGGWRDSYRTLLPGRYGNAAFNAAAGGAAGAFSLSDNANEIALFSDRGRVRTNGLANTNRIKPDIVAPGTNVLSCRSQWVAQPPALPGPPPIAAGFWNANPDSMLAAGLNRNLHQILSGTSMATPMVSGSALLVRQFYRSRFAQMRRPLLLEGVPIPAAAPLPVFGQPPAIARHPDGLLCAWITPALPAGQKNIVAMRIGQQLLPIDGAPVHLQDDVGEHAAPQIASLGERSYLLHRHGDGKMYLSCYDRNLQLIPGFGTAGRVTLAPDARPDDAAPPDLIAGNGQLACVFPTAAGNGYFFQRFRADTGAPVDNASISFLFLDSTGPHQSLVWNGSRFAVCGVVRPGNYQVQLRQMNSAGQVQGAGPLTVLEQAAEVREPCLLWDGRSAQYALVWCDARSVAGGEIWLQFLDANAAAVGAAQRVLSISAGQRMRRPRLFCHPDNGYVLLWEDDSQNGRFDVYLAFLDAAGGVDNRLAVAADDVLNRRLLRLSDTPGDCDGFAALAGADGLTLIYQSPDELNSDRLGVYALKLTPGGAFAAQEDPGTPLLKSGRYVVAPSLEHGSVALSTLSAAWSGGSYYLLRLAPGGGIDDRLQCLRLHADGAVDGSYGVNGIRELASPFLPFGCELLWTGNDRLIAAISDLLTGISLHLLDAQGAPVANFGTAGTAALLDTLPINERITPQIGFFTAPALQVLVGYGTTQAGVLQLRQQRINHLGVRVGNAANLAAADGVARHDWFQYVNGEARSIAIYHRVNGAVTRVHCRRFRVNGSTDGAERNLSAAAGEALNGVLARRPTAANSSQREYGAAWQYRANNAVPWEIHFSRLDRQGRPMAKPPGTTPPMPVADVAVITAATPGWSATRDAVEPQLVCTYTHEAWANPPPVLPAGTSLPAWSPAYGLAWIGVEADATRALYFTVLDENGQGIAVAPPPPPAGALNPPAPVGILQLSAAATRVQDFRLVWNGRIFLVYWVEEDGGRLRHRYTAVNRHASQNANEIPSAALLRATLVNGATNLTPGPLPDSAAGYGWGRVNLRQSLSPMPPVTQHVRDDCAIGPGRSVTYRFMLPAGTALLRVTLNWTDPPGPRLVNHLHLTVRAPAAPGPGLRPEYRGNLWSTVAGQTHLSRAVATPAVAADKHEDVQTFKQVVLANPLAGEYEVTVSAATFPAVAFNQQNLQAFALVFSGSGPEMRFNLPAAAVAGAAVY